MVFEDWNRTSLLRLFHTRHNARNSQSTSQDFNTHISVQGLSPAVETGRALEDGTQSTRSQALTETTL